jgi:protein-L-isoaspartate(D-aspartate) O-methyltransferase
MNLDAARMQMIHQQVRAWEVLDSRVLETLSSVSRELFVPPDYRDLAFADFEIPLGHGEAMMTPTVEGKLLQALRLDALDDVLEIGTGSGFLTACLARLASRVSSIDIHADFIEAAQLRLREQGFRNVALRVEDAFHIVGSEQFDAIAVTGSVPEVPRALAALLRPGGRMFIVIGRSPVMDARRIVRQHDGAWVEESLFETALKPLVNAVVTEPFTL